MDIGSEMSPAIDISNLQLSLDKAHSDIKVEGFVLSKLADKVIEKFKTQIFDKIIQ